MSGKSKAHRDETAREAAVIVSLVGVHNHDALPADEADRQLRGMVAELVARVECHPRTARRHILNALEAQRQLPDADDWQGWGWGGVRPGAGAPAGNRNAAGRSQAADNL